MGGTLAYTEQATTFEINFDTSTETFTITGIAGGTLTLAQVVDLLEDAAYRNDSDTPNISNRVFSSWPMMGQRAPNGPSV